MLSRDKTKKLDKGRPVIVHCIALLVQGATHCDDDDAIHAAWNVYEYLGRPETAGSIPPEVARQIFKPFHAPQS